MTAILEALIDTLTFFPRGLVYVGLGLVVLFLAKIGRDLVTRHRIDEELTEKKNLAEALRLSGYLLGVILVFLGAIYQPFTQVVSVSELGLSQAFWVDVLRVFLYSLAGIVALNLVRPLMDRLILYKFNLEKEIIDEQNVGTGAAEFGLNVAAGLAIGGAISGSGSGSEVSQAYTALAFSALGLAVLILFALFYQLTTRFDVHAEIEGGNMAVGVVLGANLIAIGLVTLKALFGDFIGWQHSIIEFLIFAVIGLVLLYVLRLVVDLILLPHTRVSEELGTGKNLGMAFVESMVVISSALILFFAI